jgi:hypothetical protein
MIKKPACRLGMFNEMKIVHDTQRLALNMKWKFIRFEKEQIT